VTDKTRARKRRVALAKAKRRAYEIVSGWIPAPHRQQTKEEIVKERWEIAMRIYRNRKPCSNCCCGNPRRHFGKLTLQERRYLAEDNTEMCA